MGRENEVKEVERKIHTLRSRTLRRFLMLYLVSYGLMPLWVLEYGAGKRRYPGIKAIQRYLKCGLRTAQDYQTAFSLIDRINRLHGKVTREVVEGMKIRKRNE